MADELVIQTDTATLVVLDPECLQHRDSDECDWWSDPDEELKEVRSGSALFVALGADGVYRVRVTVEGAALPDPQLAARVRCSSGLLFLGPGEDTPGAGSRPGTRLGGAYYELPKGTYRVCMTRPEQWDLLVSLAAVPGEPANDVAEPLELPLLRK